MAAQDLAGPYKKAHNEGRTLIFIDESGPFRSPSQKPHRCRSWAPRGQTPVLKFNFNWHKLSVAAGLTLRNFYFRLYPGAIGQTDLIDFLKALLRHIDKPLLIVWDRLPAHRSRLVREFIELSEGHIVTEYLPPYAPELNPVEYIWAYWKQHELPNVCPKDYGELSRRARQALRPPAPQTALDYCLLEAVFSLLRLTLFYARLNSAEFPAETPLHQVVKAQIVNLQVVGTTALWKSCQARKTSQQVRSRLRRIASEKSFRLRWRNRNLMATPAALSSGRYHTGGGLTALENGHVLGFTIQAWRAGKGRTPTEPAGRPRRPSCTTGAAAPGNGRRPKEPTMCGRITQQLPSDQICDLYSLQGTLLPANRQPRYNGAPGQDFTACRVDENGARAIALLR